MDQADKEIAEQARLLFAGECDYVLSASMPDHLESIPVELPEIAFWGRSNVGKSSLINGITGRKKLARSSNTPGRTRQIIFFNLQETLLFADLPGYGHAKASKTEIKQWNNFIRVYMKYRQELRCVMILIDARRGIKEIDEEKMAFLDEMGVPYRLVLTKTDQVKKGLDKVIAETEGALKLHPAAWPTVLVTSSEKKTGMEELRTYLYNLAMSG